VLIAVSKYFLIIACEVIKMPRDVIVGGVEKKEEHEEHLGMEAPPPSERKVACSQGAASAISLISQKKNFGRPNVSGFVPTVVAFSATSSSSPSFSSSISPAWINYGRLSVYAPLFLKGLAFVMLQHKSSSVESLQDGRFPITSRNLFFGENPGQLKQIKKARDLLAPLQDMLGPRALNRQAVFCNSKRREECFIPMIIQPEQSSGEQQIQFGMYVYPWLSRNVAFPVSSSAPAEESPKVAVPPLETQRKKVVAVSVGAASVTDVFSSTEAHAISSSRFKKFVTAGCMFGTTLRGITDTESFRPIIKHDIRFPRGEKIVDIEFDPKEGSPYEAMLFGECAELAPFISKTAVESSNPKELLYHLPYYDYMLFGIKLFIHGRITLPALDKFFMEVWAKKDMHMEKIREIFSHNNIHVTLASPFKNLLGFLEIAEPHPIMQPGIAAYVLKSLDISCEEVNPESSGHENREMLFVQHCLEMLCVNNIDPAQQEVWKDFLGAATDKPNNIEDLFKIGNALIIGCAAKNEPDLAVCAIEALSEKQIQIGYQQFAKSLSPAQYPAVYNLTYLDSIGFFDQATLNSNALVFYNPAPSNDSMADLINRLGLIAQLHRNVAKYAADIPAILPQQDQMTAAASKKEVLIGEQVSVQTTTFLAH